MTNVTNTDAERVSDIVARLRPSFNTDLPVAHAIDKCREEEAKYTAAALSRWLVENNALKSDAMDIIEAQSKALAEAGAGREATRANFHTMQGAAAELLKRAQKAEAILAEIAAISPVPLSEADVAPEMFRKLNHAIKLARSTPTPENPNG